MPRLAEPATLAACAPPRAAARRTAGRGLRRLLAAAVLACLAPALAAQELPGAGAEPPVIPSGDTGVADFVFDGPSEPADAGMMFQRGELAPADAAPAAGVSAPAPAAASASPVVVELFTSQGCSTCPDADSLLVALAGRADVLPLAFHVDYWDYLGWPDAFARPEFTARQKAYARRSGERGMYTPQIVVGGVDTLIDALPVALESLIDAHRHEASMIGLSVTPDGARLRIELLPGARDTGPASVELVRYLPQRVVEIGAGENRARRIDYRNIVVAMERVATWDGRQPLRLVVTPGAGGAAPLPADTRHAVLVQRIAARRSPGEILAAVPLD